MVDIYWLILGSVIGFFFSAYIAWKSENGKRGLLFKSSIALIIGMSFATFVVKGQKDVIRTNEAIIASLHSELAEFQTEVSALKNEFGRIVVRNKNLKEKVLQHVELNNLRAIVFQKDDPLSTNTHIHEVNRRKPTSDNAFYIAFNSYGDPDKSGNIHGANFQLNFSDLEGTEIDKKRCEIFIETKKEIQCHLNISRFAIQKLRVNDYIYSFAISEEINLQNESIFVQINKEIDIRSFFSSPFDNLD